MKKVLLSLLLVLFISSIVFAEEDMAEKEESLVMKVGHFEKKEEKIIGTGGVIVLKGDIEINAKQLTYYEEEKRAEITNDVHLVHDKGEISSNTMEAWLEDDRYIFQDNVKMVQNLTDGKFNLTSPYLVLLKEDNSFQAERGVVIDYNERTLKGEKVLYNDQEETLELIGNVYIEEENGDWVKSENAIFYLETEEFNAEGGVELEIKI